MSAWLYLRRPLGASRFLRAHLRITFRGLQILAQLLRRPPRTVAWRVALAPPSFLQRAGIHGVETKLVEELSHCVLCRRIIASDGERPPVLRAGRPTVRRELSGVNVIERLHDLRGRQVALQQL